MNKLWTKNNWDLDKTIEAFETKDDLLLDQKLIRYDAWGTLAHAMGLAKIGILSENELKKAKEGLIDILALDTAGKFILEDGDEDVHTKIENFLTEKYGPVGKKVHTGRSRNDQVLTAIRLYSKDKLQDIWEELVSLIEIFLSFAKKYEYIPMPGYTHMQKAMPSSLGLWSESFAEGLLDSLFLLKAAYTLNNQSPLGSAAAFGVPLPLNRKYTAHVLGFSQVQNNSLNCQNSRGKIEAIVASTLISILQDINKFASDVLLFTTSEYNFLKVTDSLCSGSSIMPQKKNIDIAELLRSKVHIVLGNYIQLVGISSNLISGYNRDLQDTKKPLMDSLEITSDCLNASIILVQNITPNLEVLRNAMTNDLYATHQALEKVKDGKTFRDAYQEISSSHPEFSSGSKNKKMLKQVQHDKIINKIQLILKQSTHIGGTGNLGLSNLDRIIKKEIHMLTEEKETFAKAITKLLQIDKGE